MACSIFCEISKGFGNRDFHLIFNYFVLNIKFCTGAGTATALDLRMSSASFGILIFVVNSTTAVPHSSNQIQNSKDFETLDYLHGRIVIAIGSFIIAWNEQIRWYPIKSVTLISIFCDRRVSAKNIQSLDVENGLCDLLKFNEKIFGIIDFFPWNFRIGRKCYAYTVDDKRPAKWQWFDNRPY